MKVRLQETVPPDRHGPGLVGAYIWSEDIGDKFAGLTPAARIEAALADG